MRLRSIKFEMMKQTLKNQTLLSNNILKSSAGILLITLLVKILGYAEKLILAKYYGTSYQVDAYTLVLTIILSIFFFFREIIEPGFLNVFLDCKGRNKETDAWSIFNKVLRWILLVTLVVCFGAFIFPHGVLAIFAPGFKGETLIIASQLIRIAIPAGIFLALSTLTSITLNGLKIFVLPASGELVFKASIIICMVLFYKEYGIVGAGIGIVIGSVGRLVAHLTKLYKKVSLRKVHVESTYKRQIWLLTWPLLLGVSFSQVIALVDNVYASFLQEGAISALSYAKKVVDLPVLLFPYVVSIVIFPYFTQLAVEKQNEKLNRLLGDALKWILIVFIPISVFFVAFSRPIIEIIFQRGAFDANSTLLTSSPFMIYSTGLVFFAIETILVIFYYSKADTRTPVFVGIGCVVINIILTWIFIQYMGYVGIALAFVLQKALKNTILLLLLKRRIDFRPSGIWSNLSKVLVASLLFLLMVLLGKYFFHAVIGNIIFKMAVLGVIFVLSGLVYMGALYILKAIKFQHPGRSNG